MNSTDRSRQDARWSVPADLRRRARPRRHLLAGAAAGMAMIAIAVGGCSSSGSPPSGSSGGGTQGASTSAVSTSQVQKLINQAFQTPIPLSSLPPTVVQAFEAAAHPLTQAQLNTALTCWQGATCSTGTGGPITLGIADGFGDNTWRKFTKMEIILQALEYPQVGKIIYTNAHGQLSQMQADIRSLTAQGVKAIVTYDDFGSAVVPEFAAAQRAGAKVSSYVGGIPDAPATAVANQVSADICAVGKAMADTADTLLNGTGQVAFFNGTPGNPQGVAWNKCAQQEFSAKGSGVSVAYEADTDWTPAGAYQAASGLVSSGKAVKAILYDYADPLTQVVKAFQQAGKTSPALITWTSNNALFGAWQQDQSTPDAFSLYYTNGLNWESRVSVTAVLDLLAGKAVPSQVTVPMPFVKAAMGIYTPSLPGDYPGPSVLVPMSLITKMLS